MRDYGAVRLSHAYSLACHSGVDEGTIMALCGWKTRAMFDRYNIVNDADLAAAVAKRYNGTVAA